MILIAALGYLVDGIFFAESSCQSSEVGNGYRRFEVKLNRSAAETKLLHLGMIS